MRNKLVSACLCLLMSFGIVLPLLVTNTSDTFEFTKPVGRVELSEVSDVWYHDCTNLTGFTNITDSSWFYPFNSSDQTIVNGDISAGTSGIQANDIGSGSDWHGPVRSIPLSDPFKISELVRFDARIGFDSSIGSQLGGIRVMLHDSNQRVICQFNIFDSWVDDKQLKMPAHWAFLNGSSTGTPWSEPDWVTFAPYDETLTIKQNSTGFYAMIPEIGDFRLNIRSNDDLDRVASYVSVWFAGNSGYSFCDSVYLHSIRFEWTSQVEPDVLTIDHPADIVYNVGETGNNITWTPSSYQPGMYQLFVNNELADSGLWFGDQIVVDVDGLSSGIYNYTLRVLNIDEESVSDEVTVTVLGQIADGTLIIMSISIGSIAIIVVVNGVICRRRTGESVTNPSSYDW